MIPVSDGRDIWSPESQTIGCGLYTYDNVHVEWEVCYDEYMFCVDGSLTMHGDDGAHVMQPGDGIFIPKGNKVIYDCPGKASVVVVIYPVAIRLRLMATKHNPTRRRNIERVLANDRERMTAFGNPSEADQLTAQFGNADNADVFCGPTFLFSSGQDRVQDALPTVQT